MIDNYQITFLKMTVEKFAGSGVLIAYNRREREVVVCLRFRLFRGKTAAVIISNKSKGTIQQIEGSLKLSLIHI